MHLQSASAFGSHAADTERRVLVFGWEPRWDHLPLALMEHGKGTLHARGSWSLRVVLVGRADAACWTRVAARYPELEQVVEYRQSLDDWASLEALIDSLNPESAHALLVLPDRSRPDPDSVSRRICARLRSARRDSPLPPLIVVIADPDARPDFAAFRQSTVLHEDSLRATLLASASMDVVAFQALEQLIAGQEVLLEAPVPATLRARTFGEVLIGLEALPDGTPISPVGVRQPRVHASESLWRRLVRNASRSMESGILLAPGYDFPLASAMSLVILAPRVFTEEELEEAAGKAFSRGSGT